MKRMASKLSAVVCCLLLVSCLPEDQAVQPHVPGANEEGFVAMGGEYKQRVYFDLGSNREVLVEDVDGWDLAIACADGAFHIRLNTGRIMGVADMGSRDFAAVSDTTGASWNYDAPSGNSDSTAFGNWLDADALPLRPYDKLYLIDRGYDAEGDRSGFVKVQITSVSAESYGLRFAKLDGSGENEAEIKRDKSFNYVGFSFDDGGVAKFIEPPSQEWDLVFTKYTELFRIPELVVYSVTGVLTNPAGVQVAIDTTRSFEEIDFATLPTYTFTSDWDAVGFDWKVFSLEERLFSIVPGRIFIIKDMEGFAYKLRFVDFYDAAGTKGHPKFEFQRL